MSRKTKSIYRSELMALCQVFIPIDVAFACVSEMGDLGIVQFQELNAKLSGFQRKYVNEVRRCDEMERKLRLIEKEIKLGGLQEKFPDRPPDTPTHKEMNYIETKVDLLDAEIRNMRHRLKDMNTDLMSLIELKYVLRNTQLFFEEVDVVESDAGPSPAMNEDENLLETGMLTRRELRELAETAAMKLSFIAGVLRRDKVAGFELALWRSGHGNVLFRYSDINETITDPTTGDEVKKVVFIIFCQGQHLKNRVRKICEGYKATIYPCPETAAERREQSTRVVNTIQDLKLVMVRSEEHVLRILSASAKAVPTWSIKIRKMKAIYHIMNMFAYDVTTNCLIAECWIPEVDVLTVTYALMKATDVSGSNIPPILNTMKTNADPPTFNRVNKFTSGFQALVDAYGVASYREVNPAAFTAITFPFLFAIMFGDVGHGVIVMLFGLVLICIEHKIKLKPNDEMAKIFYGGRYIIFLMGLFSIYTGLIYNDVFSKALSFTPSAWKINYNLSTLFNNIPTLELDPGDVVVFTQPYVFGIDPVWAYAENKINFLNSFKMKLSIILGVFHMMFGVIASQRNYKYFKKRISIWCEFVPQILFLICLFGYLAFLMCFKWMFYGSQKEPQRGPYCAPSILIKFIDMVLLKSTPPLPGCDEDMFPYQGYIQYALLGTGLICIPWMLFTKPLAIMARHRRKVMRMIESAERSRIYSRVQIETRASIVPEIEQSSYEPVSTDDITHAPTFIPQTGAEDTPQTVTEDIPHTGPEEVPPAEPYSISAQASLIYSVYGDESEDSEVSDNEGDDMAEMFIHQAIHTIEYVLGSVSHTASYLRLWALSLAHQQLSEVLWTMVLGMSLTFEENLLYGFVNAIFIAVAFAFWGILTVSVLVLMEGLSAFLHTLRLHWVEFQSKFYHGLGYRFTPFSFTVVLETLAVERAELDLD